MAGKRGAFEGRRVGSERNRGNEQLIGGLVLIAIGALFLADRMWWFDFGWFFSRFWPLMLIGMGVVLLFRNRSPKESYAGPIVLIVIGVIFQADKLDWFDWRMRTMWPVILIGIGVALLLDRLRAMAAQRTLPPSSAGPHSSSPHETPQAR
ncbi:MAG: LiaI-LiaF-like domain-containing protein [Candidatus Acidiferrales bacterium]